MESNLKETFKTLPKPFNSKGIPNGYLRLIFPLFKKEVVTKRDLLKAVGIDLKAEPQKRNSYSSTLAKLSGAKVLSVKAKGSGHWRRGENWELFMTWLTINILDNKKLRPNFQDLLVHYESNTLDFIMKN